jgi:phosphopantetheinyl transferase
MIRYLDLTSSTAQRLVASCATPEDHADAGRHRLERRRRQSLAVRVLARAMLCGDAESEDAGIEPGAWRFARGAHGAPIGAVAGSVERALSFAHSADRVACAVARHGPIGLDIEHIRGNRAVVALARAAFGPAEVSEVEAGGAAAFYRIWVLREALAKATGQGFGLLANRQDVVLPKEEDGPGGLRFESVLWRTGCWTVDDGYAIGFVRRDVPEESEMLPIPRMFGPADPHGT